MQGILCNFVPYDSMNKYDENISCFSVHILHCFDNDFEKFHKALEFCFNNFILVESVLSQGRYVNNLDNKLDVSFVDKIDSNDDNGQVIYIDVGMGNYYIM